MRLLTFRVLKPLPKIIIQYIRYDLATNRMFIAELARLYWT